MPERRDPMPAVLARLEQKVDDLKSTVSEMRMQQQQFVTYDRLELEIAARNNAFGQISSTLSQHIQEAQAARVQGENIVTTRLVPLENAYQQFIGAVKFNRAALAVMGSGELLLVILVMRDKVHFG